MPRHQRFVSLLPLVSVLIGTVSAAAQGRNAWRPGQGIPGVMGTVYTMTEYDDGTGPALYVGGDFLAAGTASVQNVAKWDGTRWWAVGDGLSGPVRALAVHNGLLYAGGTFTEGPGPNLARWNGSSWEGVAGGTNGAVLALTGFGEELILGGEFTQVGGAMPANGVAGWNPTGGWSPLGSGMDGAICALQVYGGQLIAGGSFGSPGRNIARWTGSSWLGMGDLIADVGPGAVWSLNVFEGRLIAGGDFSRAGGISASGVAAWDGVEWSSFDGHTYDVNSVAFSPDGTKVLSGSSDGTARLWDANTGTQLRLFRPSDYPVTVYSVAFSPDGTKVLIGDTYRAEMWDANTGQHLLSTPFNWSEPVLSVAFSHDGAKILTAHSTEVYGGWGGYAAIRETRSGQLMETFDLGSIVHSVAFSADDTRVLVGTQDGRAKLLWVYGGGTYATFSGHTAAVNSVAFSSDGTKVLTGSNDGTAKLWNATTTAVLQTFSGHTSAVNSVAFSPDGTKILTGSNDGTAKLWNLGNGTVLRTFTAPWGDVCSATFSPDGSRALTGGHLYLESIGEYEYSARLWDIGSGNVVWKTPYGCPEPTYALTAYHDAEKDRDMLISAGWCSNCGYLLRWDSTNRGWSKDWGSVSGLVYVFANYRGALLAGGEILSAGGGRAALGVARWEGGAWSGLCSGLTSPPTLFGYRGDLIGFGDLGGYGACYLGRWDGKDWSLFGGQVRGCTVNAMADYQDGLVIGGLFARAEPIFAHSVVRWNWDPDYWQELGGGLAPAFGVTSMTVYHDMLANRDDLIVGGDFTNTWYGLLVNGVARWDGENWSALGSGSCRVVDALTVYRNPVTGQDELIGTGGFVSCDWPLDPSYMICRWDGTNWSPLSSGGWGPEYDVRIGALTTYNGELIAAGFFDTAGGCPAHNIARWNGQFWSPLGDGTNGHVNALAVYRDATTGREELIVGGEFTSAGGITANNIACWDGQEWHALDTGTNAPVKSLAVYENPLTGGSELGVAGDFTVAGGLVSAYWARWCPCAAADFNCDGPVDGYDAATVVACMSGPAVPYDPAHLPDGCMLSPDSQGKILADFDKDGDVDQDDFGVFQRCFSGANKPADPNCAN